MKKLKAGISVLLISVSAAGFAMIVAAASAQSTEVQKAGIEAVDPFNAITAAGVAAAIGLAVFFIRYKRNSQSKVGNTAQMHT